MNLLIVNYHYFRQNKPSSGIYPLTLEEFKYQIDEISKYYDFVSEEELILPGFAERNRGRNLCLLTFDDGLKEQMEAFEVLLHKGISGIFYVSTDCLREHSVLSVHKLHYVRSKMKDQAIFEFLEKEYNITSYAFDELLMKNQYRYDSDVARQIKYFLNFMLSNQKKEEVINRLFEELEDSESAFSKNLYMSDEDIKRLHQHGMLGTHSSRHVPLASLEKVDIERNIRDSITYLEKTTGGPIHSISYPYGGKSAVNEEVALLAEKSGLKFGLTMQRGINNFADFMEKRFLLKRVDTNDAPGGKLKSLEYCL